LEASEVEAVLAMMLLLLMIMMMDEVER